MALGLGGEILDEFPAQLYPCCGRGIRSWRYPIQFANYLTHLSGRNIKSYVEIRCRFGGTFIVVVEYFRRFTGLHDITNAVSPGVMPRGYAPGLCPGVVRTWGEIRHVVPSGRIFDATDQYRDVRDRTGKTFLGIGLVDFS